MCEKCEALRQSVAEWIRSEYHFRWGPHRYTNMTTKLYVDAEIRLRRKLTKKGDLQKAFAALQSSPEETNDGAET